MKWAERLQKREPPNVAAPESTAAPDLTLASSREPNPQAASSLACGILGFIFPIVASILGIRFGMSALRRVREQGAGGRRVAIAGISISIASLLISVCVLAIIIPQMIHASSAGNLARCADNLRQIGQALQLYANENN